MRWVALIALIPFVLGISPALECENTVITQQRTIETQGVKLNFTVEECADTTGVRARSKNNRRSTVFDSLSSLQDLAKRQSSQCTLPAPHCVCDYPCTDVQCFGPRQFIEPEDCNQLGTILVQLNGTFIIEAGQTVGVQYFSCAYKLYNNEASGFDMEYCFNSLGRVGLSQLFSNCAGKEAYCSGGTLPGYSLFYIEQLATSGLGDTPGG